MFQSLIVYAGVAFFMSFSLYLYSKLTNTNKVCLLHPLVFFSLLIYVLIFAFRYNVGVDYPGYYSDYILAKKYIDYESLSYEPLFSWFTWILANNGQHFTVYFGIIAFVQIFFLYKSFERKAYLLPYLIISFFLSFTFITWHNVIRQNIVIAVFVYIVLRRRKISFLLYLSIVFLCFFIHKSSVVLLLFYPLLKKNYLEIKNTTLCLFIFFSCVLIGLKYDLFSSIMGNSTFANFMVNMDYGTYVLNEEYAVQGMGKSMGIGFFLRLLNEVIILCTSGNLKRFYRNDDDFRVCYNLYFLGICFLYLIPLSMVLQRPNLYLRIFSLPIYAYYIYYIFHLKNKMSLIAILGYLFITIFLLLFFYQIYEPTGHLAEYHFYWEFL